MKHEVLEDNIRKLLREFKQAEPYADTESKLSLDKLPESKIRSMFLYQLLKLIGSRLKDLLAEIGSDRLYSLLLALGNEKLFDDEYAKSIWQEKFNELKNINTHLPADSLWDNFLILLGLYPYYSDVLATYFGEDGLVSLAILLKSLIEGRLDISVPLYAIERYLA